MSPSSGLYLQNKIIANTNAEVVTFRKVKKSAESQIQVMFGIVSWNL